MHRSLRVRLEKQTEEAIDTAAACSAGVDTSCSTSLSHPSLQWTVSAQVIQPPGPSGLPLLPLHSNADLKAGKSVCRHLQHLKQQQPLMSLEILCY